jgi:hypothetical protein
LCRLVPYSSGWYHPVYTITQFSCLMVSIRAIW